MRDDNRGQPPDNIYWRNGVAYGRVEIAGREHRRSLRTTDPQEAARRVADWIEELKADAGLIERPMTWMDAVVRYIEEVAPGAVKPDVLTRYQCSLKQVHPWLGHMEVRKITRRTIADMVGGRKRAGVTNATINRDLTAVSRVLAACVAWGWCDDNLAKTFDRGAMTRERRDPIVLPPEEHIQALIDAAVPMFGLMIQIYRFTGMREKEVAGLEWTQIEMTGHRMAVNLTRTKTDRPRSIPLDDIETTMATKVLRTVPRYLRTRVEREAGGNPVFWHGEGEPYLTVSSLFGALRRRVNAERARAGRDQITFRLHDLRHLFAVTYLRKGGNVYKLQKILGHSSIKTTELYLAYLTPDEQMIAQHGKGTVTALSGRSAQ
ncbi:tyrosine-type recombinase/integrase [Magnetospirillum fulvum]|uniref:Putative integrase n=1 Tax=Magnetospirillum fulvum MGU-K5 TaxID=1316936 RepID=S9TZ00_MAGFU|nr:site-specific integrase [Magnetospirillum fulvum]EPY03535.1 putative integrase [Magnetospirillum fulvum MGU-K5]